MSHECLWLNLNIVVIPAVSAADQLQYRIFGSLFSESSLLLRKHGVETKQNLTAKVNFIHFRLLFIGKENSVELCTSTEHFPV